MLEQFSGRILRPRAEVDCDEVLTAHIVELMMDNYVEIMKVPEDLKDKIEDKLTWLRKSKVGLLTLDVCSCDERHCCLLILCLISCSEYIIISVYH